LANISSEPSDFVTPSGYSSREKEIPVCPLQIDDIPPAILEILSPTETELKDRGKSDGLTKLIVLVQTLWFIIQCIARGRQHLPLTELEVVTLAYTMLNFFIYALWWNKPQNVGCPIRVYKTSTAEHRRGGKEVMEWETSGTMRLFDRIVTYFTGIQDDYVDYSQNSPLPMFWSGQPDGERGTLAVVGMSLLATGFGGLHFIAWHSEFPSLAELTLWRVACMLLTVIPPTLFIVVAVGATLVDQGLETSALFPIIPLFIPLYIAGRAATLLIAFTTLRSLPDEALIDVDWTVLIPHI
jgi:hypothetical protein